MYKGALLNSGLLTVIGEMGHTDKLAIGDAGLPIPAGVKRIDLAVTENLPGFLETLDAVLSSLEVESVLLAEEIKSYNPTLYKALLSRFSEAQISFVSHERFKEMTQTAKAVVRTGECSPYANIILVSGVTFK